ncbi:hypothetical protein EMIT0P43_30173 [Pseudomonas jessenii]
MGAGEGPETGLGGGVGAAGVSPSGAPHSLQNLAETPASWPQRGQLRDSLVLHASQELAPEGFSNPQFAQRIRSLPICTRSRRPLKRRKTWHRAGES